MRHSFTLALLWLSPLLITFGCVAAGVWIQKLRQRRGPREPRWHVVALLILVWALHAGYLLAPWLWSSQKGALAFLLMLPLAVPILGGAAIASQRLRSAVRRPPPSGVPATPSLASAAAAALVLAYAVPLMIVFAGAPRIPFGTPPSVDLTPASGFLGCIFGVIGLVAGSTSVIWLLVLTRAEGQSPNPSPVQVGHFRQVVLIQRLVIGLIGLAIFCAILALWAMVAGRPWLGGGLGLLPLLASGAVVAYWNAREV